MSNVNIVLKVLVNLMKKISSIFQQILLGILIGLGLGGCILFLFSDDFLINFGFDTMIYFVIML